MSILYIYIYYPQGLNYPNDSGNVYQGIAGIEIRGSYSATLPQKPFGIETRDIQGNNNNVPLFGMPQENDWILIANYNDKTFLRNVLAFDLFEKMGHYAPRTKLCEVVINDIYNGIYVFTEKIKRDNGRVDISKLDLDDNAGDSLTGGYIFRRIIGMGIIVGYLITIIQIFQMMKLDLSIIIQTMMRFLYSRKITYKH